MFLLLLIILRVVLRVTTKLARKTCVLQTRINRIDLKISQSNQEKGILEKNYIVSRNKKNIYFIYDFFLLIFKNKSKLSYLQIYRQITVQGEEILDYMPGR